LHDPVREPRNQLRWLPELRRWQAERLERSFDRFLQDPRSAPAAHFFLTDVYGDHDFRRRDADIARVLPTMQRLLPSSLLATVSDGLALGASPMPSICAWRRCSTPSRRAVAASTTRATRRPIAAVGLPRLRGRQIDLIREVGHGLGRALRLPGIGTLLRMSRGPAHAAGLAELQGFLERGVAAFRELRDVDAFLADIERSERRIAARIAAGHPDPFEEARSAEAFGQHALDFLLDGALHRRQQEPELRAHVQLLGLQRDVAVHAGALEVQDVAFPAARHPEAGVELLRHLLHGLAGLVLGQGVRMADIDRGHGQVSEKGWRHCARMLDSCAVDTLRLRFPNSNQPDVAIGPGLHGLGRGADGVLVVAPPEGREARTAAPALAHLCVDRRGTWLKLPTARAACTSTAAR
jgi:hypothetical protein